MSSFSWRSMVKQKIYWYYLKASDYFKTTDVFWCIRLKKLCILLQFTSRSRMNSRIQCLLLVFHSHSGNEENCSRLFIYYTLKYSIRILFPWVFFFFCILLKIGLLWFRKRIESWLRFVVIGLLQITLAIN